MKLHLPISLRKSLLSLFAIALTTTVPMLDAAIMNSDVSLITYADYGQNLGRYKTDATANALLSYIRERDGGVVLTYIGGQSDYLLPHEMPNFTGTTNDGAFMSLGYNATVSVQHNGVTSGGFTGGYLESNQQVLYQGIEYRIDNSETFLHSPNGGYDNRSNGGFDHKVTRMSKVITDVETATLFSGTSDEMRKYAMGKLVYHAGAGSMGMYDTTTGTISGLAGAYSYIIGGIDTVDGVNSGGKDGVGDIIHTQFEMEGYYSISSSQPMPFAGQGGDSGSPIFIYNENTQQYEYVGAAAYIGGYGTSTWGAVSYVDQVLNSYDKVVSSASSLHIGAVNKAGDIVSADNVGYNYGMNRPVSTTPYSGTVTDASGNVLQTFVGVKSGINTWKDLSGVIDSDSWYNYNNDYLNAAPYIEGADATEGKELTYADLFLTDNLVFKAAAASTDVVLDATVDLGIGYAQFSLGEGMETARFNISSGGDGSYQFNHAGYVIDAGVEVHTTLTGSANHVYEWRKIGDGDLYVEGTGNNKVLLNLGGSGTTYLNRDNGYAAYNVLANTGTTVVISNINQIARDFTFGHQGGVLDMNGNSMTWNNDNSDVSAAGFTIHALDESAIVANLKSGSTTTLTWTQSGDQTFLGSFRDNGKDSVLQFVYDGGVGSKLTLNSIYTNLSTEGSGITVNSGSLSLVGTNTVHGKGSASGRNADRYFSELDWHYADATTDVTVKNGATFELGSHARLTGDVTVEAGGAFVMRESVQHEQEYIEGGQRLESTSAIADFHGLKGNVSLAAGANMRVEYNEGVTANAVYAGNISGQGNVSIDLKSSEISLTLSGNNTFSGTKTLNNGVLIGENVASLGDTTTNKWLVEENAWIASHAESGEALLARVDSASSGTLALSQNTETQLNLNNHTSLYIGAELGKVVEYGAAGTTEALTAVNGAWRLGGGGGDLIVNYLLTGDNVLMLGAGELASGSVHLSNSGNNFTGKIIFNSTGIRFSYDDGALGGAIVGLTYGNGLLLSTDASLANIKEDSAGIALVDNMATGAIDMTSHAALALGASEDVEYSGSINVGANQAYRFAAMNGATFMLNSTLAAGHDVIVDGQGLSGGTVVLGGASAVNGTVTVMGHKDGQQGDITLGFAADNALSGVAAVHVEKGGIVDVGNTTQTLNNLQLATGGLLTGDNNGKAVLNAINRSTLSGTIQLGNIEKIGADEVVLNSVDNNWNQFSVKEGTLRLNVDNALSEQGVTRVESGATLNLGARDNTSNAGAVVRRTGGNIVLADGATLLTGSEDTDNLTALTGSLSVDAGARAIVSGQHLELVGKEHNTNGGTIDFEAGTLYLNQTTEQHVGGTVNIAQNTTFSSGGSAQDMVKHFDHVNVGSGKSLAIEDLTWNTIWQLDKLSGEGTVTWNSDTNHSTTARTIIGGDGEFSGSINFNRKFDNGSRRYQAYLEVNGENAISGATLNLNGGHNVKNQANAMATFAVNASNVNIGGLNGNAYSHVMAGAAVTNSAQNTAPGSTRNATLTFTGSGNYTYSGTMGTTADTSENGITLVKTGSGTQTLNGASVVLSNVSALAGTLNITSSSLTVSGNVSLARGAELKLGDSYSLNEGQKLYLMAGAENSGAAVFNSALVFNGGSISIDARGLSVDSPLLALGGAVTVGSSFGASCQLSFSNTSVISMETDYLLATGDWSAVAGKLTCDTGEYLTATLGATSNGLQVTFALADGYSVWRGDESVLQAGSKLLFGGFGGSNDVALSAPASIGSAYFDNLSDVTVSSANGASLTADLIEKRGTGALVINNTVNGDTLRVAESSLLTGSGRLAVDTMEISRGAQASISKLTVVVESAITGDGVLHMGQDSTLQVGSSVGGNVLLTDGSTLVAADSSVSTNLTLGANGADSRVSLRMGDSSEVSLNGSIAVQGNTTLSVQGSGALQFNSAFNKLAALELQSGVNLALSSELSTHLVLDGGSASLSGDNNKILDGDVTVKNGGTLTFTGTGADIIDYNKSGKTLTVAGGTIDFGSTRQTIAGWTLTLKNGAQLLGDGGSYRKADGSGITDYTAAMDFNNNSIINVTSGENSIAANIRLRGGDGRQLTFNVSDGASLDVSGRMHSDSATATVGNVVKSGAGSVTISSQVMLGKISANAGDITVAYTGEGGNTVKAVELSLGAELRVAEGAELNISGQSLSISNRAEEGTASLAATTSTGSGEYNINRTNYQISNAHVTYTGGDATINNRLTNSAIENAGNGILKVNNAENSLSAVHATGGSIKLFSADELDLKALEVAASLSVSAYCDVREREDEEARINVSEIATFGAGVTLNADIVMKSGATLKIADTVQMGSDVRLETGLTLTGTLYNDVKSMKAGERVTLFTGVDALYLGSSQESITSITLSNGMQANDYFTNLSDSYFLIYDASLGDGQGELSIGMVVPEPTTATLSLVALAALAMRRRRK